MTFKNKKNLFHTIKRIKSIKRIKRIKSKDSRRQLSGGRPNIFTAFSSSGWVGEEGKIYENAPPDIADAFQIFMETKNISHSLKSILYGYITDTDLMDDKFLITAINVNKYFTPETIDKNKQIYTIQYSDYANAINLLANDRELLERFITKIKTRYHGSLYGSILGCLRDVDKED